MTITLFEMDEIMDSVFRFVLLSCLQILKYVGKYDG